MGLGCARDLTVVAANCKLQPPSHFNRDRISQFWVGSTGATASSGEDLYRVDQQERWAVLGQSTANRKGRPLSLPFTASGASGLSSKLVTQSANVTCTWSVWSGSLPTSMHVVLSSSAHRLTPVRSVSWIVCIHQVHTPCAQFSQ